MLAHVCVYHANMRKTFKKIYHKHDIKCIHVIGPGIYTVYYTICLKLGVHSYGYNMVNNMFSRDKTYFGNHKQTQDCAIANLLVTIVSFIELTLT